MEEPKPRTAEPIGFERVQEYVERYANHAHFLPTAWDLTMIFGELQRDPNKPSTPDLTVVEQHTSITVSWPEIKMMNFYLQIQILAHEIDDGKIYVPKRVLPPELPPEEPGVTPGQRRLREIYADLRAELLAEQENAAPAE
jgi:hypothetical protein